MRTASIDIEGVIGWDVTARQFRRDLKALGKVDELNVTLNSVGGVITEGTAIYETLKDHPATVNMHLIGIAASMGSVIPAAADNLSMASTTIMMLHKPLNFVYGNATEFRKMAGVLDKFESAVLTAYMSRAALKLNETELSAALEEETYYTAEDALEAGLIDQIGRDGAEPQGEQESEMSESAVAFFRTAGLQKMPEQIAAMIPQSGRAAASMNNPVISSAAAAELLSQLNPDQNDTTTVSSADETQEEVMSTYTQAELDAAVKAATDAARKEASAEAQADAAKQAGSEVHARYEKLMAHPNASNASAVVKLAKSSMDLDDALAIMEDMAPAKAEGESKGLSEAELNKVASDAAAKAVAKARAEASDTKNIESVSDDDGEVDKAVALAASLNKARGEVA